MKSLALDDIDIRILSAVQKHGRLSKSKLAEIVNLTPTPCWARLKRLTDAGLILGYHADVALEKICNTTKVIVSLSLSKHRKSDFERFESYVCDKSEVLSCIATGGGTDYVMTVMTQDLASFQTWMTELLEADLEVDRYMTYIVTREIKSAQPDIEQLSRAVTS